MNGIHYRESGKGQTVVLIHGFPMNHRVWHDFAEKLSTSCHVVTPDLPGFGESPGLPDGFTLEDVAASLHRWMIEAGFSQPVLVGHSLGGYVTLALAEKHPNTPSGICLFHSTALADSDEKKSSRNKTIDFIGKQGVEAFTTNFIRQLYADSAHPSVGRVTEIAREATRETVVGYTLAMRDRKDRTGVIRDAKRPVLLIGGAVDAGIPASTLHQQAALNRHAEAFILEEAAHMGMFESPERCRKKISEFIQKCVVTF